MEEDFSGPFSLNSATVLCVQTGSMLTSHTCSVRSVAIKPAVVDFAEVSECGKRIPLQNYPNVFYVPLSLCSPTREVERNSLSSSESCNSLFQNCRQ